MLLVDVITLRTCWEISSENKAGLFILYGIRIYRILFLGGKPCRCVDDLRIIMTNDTDLKQVSGIFFI